MSWLSSATKKAGKALQKAGANPLVNLATGGIAGTAGELSKGTKANVGGAVKNIATGGLAGVDSGKNGNGLLGVGGLVSNGLNGIQDGMRAATAVSAADSSGLQNTSNDLLNPVGTQFQDMANGANITSNVDPAFRQYQLGLAQQLQAQAAGQGPSLAQMQLQQATDRSLNQNLGAIRSATGANAALGARTASLAGAQQLGTAANASGQLALQEQQQAQQQLAALSNQGRSGDIATDSNNLQAQTATGNLKLGALNGLSTTKQAQLSTAKAIYDAEQEAKLQESKNRTALNSAGISGAAGLGSTLFGSLLSSKK